MARFRPCLSVRLPSRLHREGGRAGGRKGRGSTITSSCRSSSFCLVSSRRLPVGATAAEGRVEEEGEEGEEEEEECRSGRRSLVMRGARGR